MSFNVKLFQSVQEYFQTMGIYPTQPNQKYSFNLMSFLILVSMLVFLVPSMAFFLLKAETIEEYYNTFYASSSVLAYIACFMVNVWKMTNLLDLIARYERNILRSKLCFLVRIFCIGVFC